VKAYHGRTLHVDPVHCAVPVQASDGLRALSKNKLISFGTMPCYLGVSSLAEAPRTADHSHDPVITIQATCLTSRRPRQASQRSGG
jgi:hypothetical protein